MTGIAELTNGKDLHRTVTFYSRAEWERIRGWWDIIFSGEETKIVLSLDSKVNEKETPAETGVQINEESFHQS